MKQNAFFYDGAYYLYPEGCKSPEELMRLHANGKGFSVSYLDEKMCTPPCFIAEHVKAKRLKLAKDAEVFPCEVELLSLSEYNARLRKQVKMRCPGCSRFGSVDDTDASLKGHHKEIGLDGVCFFRAAADSKDDSYISLKDALTYTVRRFGHRGFDEMLSKGKTEEAAQAFEEFFADCLVAPTFPAFFTRTPDGKNALYFSALACASDRSIIQQFCGMLNKKYGKTWVFHSFLPRGFYAAQSLKPAGMVFTPPGEDEGASLTVYTDPEKPFDTWLWLCGRFGENRLLGRVEVTMQPASDLPKRSPKLSKTADALEEYLSALDEQLRSSGFEEVENRAIPTISSFLHRDVSPDADEETMYLNSLSVVAYDRVIANSFAIPVEGGRNPVCIWDMDCMLGETQRPLARIRFCYDGPRAAGNKLINSLIDMNLLAVCAQITEPRENAFTLWGAVLDLAGLLYELRRWTPAFIDSPVTLSVYTASQSEGGTFKLDANMTRVQTEKEMGIEYDAPRNPESAE